MVREARDSIAMMLAIVIGVFLVMSLIGVFILALNNEAPTNLWAALFSLATAAMGGVTGYLAASTQAAMKRPNIEPGQGKRKREGDEGE